MLSTDCKTRFLIEILLLFFSFFFHVFLYFFSTVTRGLAGMFKRLILYVTLDKNKYSGTKNITYLKSDSGRA